MLHPLGRPFAFIIVCAETTFLVHTLHLLGNKKPWSFSPRVHKVIVQILLRLYAPSIRNQNLQYYERPDSETMPALSRV